MRGKKEKISVEIAEKIAQAKELGKVAFASEKPSIPALDAAFTPLLAGLRPGEALPVLEAWVAGWHAANLAHPFETA